MKRILFAVLMVASFAVQAGGMWRLVHSEFVSGGWMCTYQLDGSRYVSTIFTKSYCQSLIYQ